MSASNLCNHSYTNRWVYFLFLVALLSCNKTNVPTSLNEFDVSYRILDIGNSYTDDVTMLLPHVVNGLHLKLPNFALYKAVRGGGSFRTWCNVYEDKDNNTYRVERVVGDLPTNVTTGESDPKDGSLFRALLKEEKWDLIIIHPLSNYAPYFSRWNEEGDSGGLDDLLAIIKKHQPDAKIGFYLVHSYSSDYHLNSENSSYSRWKLITASVEELCKQYDIDIIIPYGTAIQNLRLSSINNEYDLMRDGTHCGYGLCCYTASCCYYESLIAPLTGVHVLGMDVYYEVPNNQRRIQSSISVTKDNAIIAQKAAVAAVRSFHDCINPDTFIQ